MNKIVVMGRLVRDPEIRTSNSTTIARFILAVDRRFKREGQADADFFNCTAFGKTAEFAEKYLKQGTKILVTGRMEQDNYTNKDGQKVYSWNLVVEEIEFAESKAAANEAKAQSAPAEKFFDIADGIEESAGYGTMTSGEVPRRAVRDRAANSLL